MKKKNTFGLVLLILIVSGMVYADNQQQLDNINNQIKEIRTKINDKEEELSTLSADILKLDAEISTTENEIYALNTKINTIQINIDITINNIKAKEEEIKKLNEAFRNRIKTMSKINDFDYIQIMFSSKNLSDFLSNYTIIKKIINQDKDNLHNLELVKQELNNIKKEMDILKESLQNTQMEYNRRNLHLQLTKKVQEENISKLNSDVVSLRQIEEKKIQEAKEIEEEIKRLLARQNSYQGNYSGGKFAYPVTGAYISSYYGNRNHPILKTNILHTGIDFAADIGTPVFAAEEGKVIYAGLRSTYGNVVMIDHGSNIVTLYAHCNTINVTEGQLVSRGEIIATVGNTGRSTGPHLHFEVRINGAFTDPLPYIR